MIGNSREVMVQCVVPQPNRSPQFGPGGARRVNRVHQLACPVEWHTGAFIAVRSESPHGIAEADKRVDCKPNTQGFPSEMGTPENREPGGPNQQNTDLSLLDRGGQLR